MDSTITTVQEAAEIAYDWFETARRNPDESESAFVRVKDGAPEWVTDLVREAHGDFLPDDWRYEVIRNAVEWIRDNDEQESGEFADDQVDVYTGARLVWLSSNLRRASYVDEAISEFGFDTERGIIDMIGLGQYFEAQEVFGSVLSSLEDASTA
jgi:hypothetical protein